MMSARTVFRGLLRRRTPLTVGVRELAALEPNWDSYGGVPPTDAALATVAKICAESPDLIPVNDGSIELDYPSGVTIEVRPTGEIVSVGMQSWRKAET